MGIELTAAAKKALSDRGYDPVLGARPLRRTIQRDIEDSLSERILFGELKPGDIVLVDVKGEGEDLEFTFEGQERSIVPDVPPVEVIESGSSDAAGESGESSSS